MATTKHFVRLERDLDNLFIQHTSQNAHITANRATHERRILMCVLVCENCSVTDSFGCRLGRKFAEHEQFARHLGRPLASSMQF